MKEIQGKRLGVFACFLLLFLLKVNFRGVDLSSFYVPAVLAAKTFTPELAQAAEKDCSALRAALQRVQAKLAEAENKLRAIHEKLNSLPAQIGNAQNDAAKKERYLRAMEAQLLALQEEYKTEQDPTVEANIGRTESELIPQARNDYDEANNHLEALKKEMSELEAEKTKAEGGIASLKKEVDAAKKAYENCIRAQEMERKEPVREPSPAKPAPPKMPEPPSPEGKPAPAGTPAIPEMPERTAPKAPAEENGIIELPETIDVPGKMRECEEAKREVAFAEKNASESLETYIKAKNACDDAKSKLSDVKRDCDPTTLDKDVATAEEKFARRKAWLDDVQRRQMGEYSEEAEREFKEADQELNAARQKREGCRMEVLVAEGEEKQACDETARAEKIRKNALERLENARSEMIKKCAAVSKEQQKKVLEEEKEREEGKKEAQKEHKRIQSGLEGLCELDELDWFGGTLSLPSDDDLKKINPEYTLKDFLVDATEELATEIATRTPAGLQTGVQAPIPVISPTHPFWDGLLVAYQSLAREKNPCLEGFVIDAQVRNFLREFRRLEEAETFRTADYSTWFEDGTYGGLAKALDKMGIRPPYNKNAQGGAITAGDGEYARYVLSQLCEWFTLWKKFVQKKANPAAK